MTRRSDADLLEALLDGRTAAEDAPRDLSRLAGVATAVREHTEVEAPTDEFRAFFRAELVQFAAAGRPTTWDRVADRVHDATAGMRHSLRTAGAAAMASTMIGTAGVAAAAQSALPGDVLYSVKGLTEDARLAFASGDLERGRLHLGFARERLEEVEEGRQRLTADQLTETLDRLDQEAATGAEELLGAALEGTSTDPVLDELDAFTAEVRARLLDLSDDLPLSVRPAAERTLEVLRRIDVQVAGLLGSASCEICGGVPAGAPRVVLPGDGAAAPACQCVAPARSSEDDDPEDGAQPTPQEQPASQPTVPNAPADPDPSSDPSLETGTGGLGEAVDDLGGTVGDLGSEVDDAASELLEPVEDVGSIVDDLLAPSPSSTGGVVGDTTDTVDEVVDEVEDTASEVGSVVDDITGDLLD